MPRTSVTHPVRTGVRRRALLLVVVLLAALIAPGVAPSPAWAAPSSDTGATVIWESQVDSRTLDITIMSPSTEQPTRNVRLLLPEGWSKSASRTWPVLYVLHGGFDDYRSWTDKTGIEALAAGRDVIVAMPDTSWCSAYSDWWNHGDGGRPMWETFITLEVRQILQRGYRAGSRAAIAGNSMGGLGAMKLAANHDLYRAAASFSGDVDPLRQYEGGSGVTYPGLACAADWKRVWGDPAIPAQRKIWERNNPWNQAHKLRGVSLFLSSGGTRDWVEAQVHRETKGLEVKLRSLGIPVTTRYGDHGHDWSAWDANLRQAWPQLMRALGS